MNTDTAHRLRVLLFILAMGTNIAPALQSDDNRHYGEVPIVWNNFQKAIPQSSLKIDSVVEGKWNLRINSWRGVTDDVVLNSTHSAQPIQFPIDLKGKFRITIIVRKVGVCSSFRLVIPGLLDTVRIDPGIATADVHEDVEVRLPDPVDIAYPAISIVPDGNVVYLRCFKFFREVPRYPIAEVVSKRIVFSDKGKHFAFPGICKTRSGKLVVVAREAHSHIEKDDPGAIVLSESNDGGESWSHPRTLLSREGTDYRDPSVITLSTGVVLLMCNSFDSVQRTVILRSTNDGDTWKEIPSIPEVFSPNPPFEFCDTVYYCGNRSIGDVNYVDIVSAPVRSLHWKEYSTVVMGAGLAKRHFAEYYDEPSLSRTPDGVWICLFRVDRDSTIYESTSPAHGKFKTWTFPKPTGILGAPPSAIVLKNGDLLCSYGRRVEPFGIRVCRRSRDGKRWEMEGEAILDNSGFDNIDFGYAKSIELKDDTLITVYYSSMKAEGAEVKIVKWKLCTKVGREPSGAN